MLYDFISEYRFYINEGVIILAAITGLLAYNKFKNTEIRYFIYFLVYVAFIEVIGFYPSYSQNIKSFSWIHDLTVNTIFEKNYLWYAIFWSIGSLLFLSFYYRLILKNEFFKKGIKSLTIAFAVVSIIYFIVYYEAYYNSELKLISFSSAFLIILFVVLYFIEILQSDKIIVFYKSFNFYISIVFFLWLLIKTPLAFYQVYYSRADWSFVFLKRDIILFTNLFMYVTFIFAFICCKPKNL